MQNYVESECVKGSNPTHSHKLRSCGGALVYCAGTCADKVVSDRSSASFASLRVLCGAVWSRGPSPAFRFNELNILGTHYTYTSHTSMMCGEAMKY